MNFPRFAPRLLAAISAILLLVGVLAWTQLGTPAEAGNSSVPLQQSQTGATNLTATANGVGQVRLTWTAAPNATGYFVWSVKSNETGGKWTDAGGRHIVCSHRVGNQYGLLVHTPGVCRRCGEPGLVRIQQLGVRSHDQYGTTSAAFPIFRHQRRRPPTPAASSWTAAWTASAPTGAVSPSRGPASSCKSLPVVCTPAASMPGTAR